MATETVDHRIRELQYFMQSGAGVKGLVDSGLAKVPQIFIDPPETNSPSGAAGQDDLLVPVIDFAAFDGDRRAEIVALVRDVMGTWGLFQIVNHGVPVAVMEEMVEGVRRFQEEQPVEEKKEWYKRGGSGQATYEHYAEKFTAALWRDSFACYFDDGIPNQAAAVPQACSGAINKYMKSMVQLKETISEIVSEALGLKSDHLSKIKCMVSAYLLSHYYPPCPEPELVTGSGSHTDPGFLTLLLQDNIGGLQVLHQNQWVDVPFVPGAIIVNFGDLMQLVTNDKAKSARHRVLNQRVGPRISVACFFSTASEYNDKSFGPLGELLFDETAPIYKPTTPNNYYSFFRANGQRENILPYFKLAPLII